MIVRKNLARKARIREMNTRDISGINNSTPPPRSHNRRHSKRNRDHNLSGISNNTTSQYEGASYHSSKLQKRKKSKSTVHEEDDQIEVVLQRAGDHSPAKVDMRHLNHSTAPYNGSRIVSPKSDGGKRSLKQSNEHYFRMVRKRNNDDDNSISSDEAVVTHENPKTSKSVVGKTQKNTEKGRTSSFRDFFMRIKQTKHTSETKNKKTVSKPSGSTFTNEGPSNVPSSNEAVRIIKEEPILSFASDKHSTDSNIELIIDDRNDCEHTDSSFVSHQDEHEDRNDSDVIDSSFVYSTTKPSIRYGNISTRQWSRSEANKYSQVSWNAPKNSKTRDASMIKRPEVRRLDMTQKIILYLARPDLAPSYFHDISPLFSKEFSKREEEKEETPSASVRDKFLNTHAKKQAALDGHSGKKPKATRSSTKDLKRPAAEASCQMNPFCGLGKCGNGGDYSLANSNGSFEFAPQQCKGAPIEKKDDSLDRRLKSDTAAWI
eukprot:CAMPEP_0198306926 /NCGR_PEP_ID=MMETSP1449-20131203/58665_1 /TAXON_ID=420275 /ORGANISM="Attheya septentrionalis, Strain CCMP2084" /LENGTH=488 /DNA_ID=CAMNT_0044009487 /DNA_START=66 /DNA_END=1532 /DNA_ORIENTATION=+